MAFHTVFTYWALALTLLQTSGINYKAEIEQWRHTREAELTAEDSWLTLAGLFWLKEGKIRIGSAPSNGIVLPPGAPPKLGVLEFHDGVTTFHPEPGAVNVDGKPATAQTLTPDVSGAPDILRAGSLSMLIIKRGSRYGLRLRDNNSQLRRHFTGLKYYPVKPEYRVAARFMPYKPPKIIAVPNVLGETEDEASPGYLEFSLQGQVLRLDPILENRSLLLIFKDATAGKETYPAGRFLDAAMPVPGNGDEVILDFNKAYNPPCAFTPYATCPLPPRQNVLPVRIEAGELRYGH
jgi:uncharacterized protein